MAKGELSTVALSVHYVRRACRGCCIPFQILKGHVVLSACALTEKYR